MKSIAVIGAGLAGSIAALSLQKSAKVTVFEKSGRAGGRMSTRRVETYKFNHGAQFFTARNPQFKDFLEPYIEQGIVAQWNPQITTLDPLDKPFKRIWYEPHYVGMPGMSALASSLAEDLNVHYHCEIASLESIGKTWQLRDAQHNDCGEFDWVISAVPSAQALNILGSKIQQHAKIADVVFSPCFSLMLGLKNKPALGFDAAVVKNSQLAGWPRPMPTRRRIMALSFTAIMPGRKLISMTRRSYYKNNYSLARRNCSAILYRMCNMPLCIDGSMQKWKPLHRKTI